MDALDLPEERAGDGEAVDLEEGARARPGRGHPPVTVRGAGADHQEEMGVGPHPRLAREVVAFGRGGRRLDDGGVGRPLFPPGWPHRNALPTYTVSTGLPSSTSGAT